MKVIGLDIGTTTISAVVLQDGVLQESMTYQNDTFLNDATAQWKKLQDPEKILGIVTYALQKLLVRHEDVCRIGLTGQQHGILYLTKDGNPCSPLYTWQDGRGDQTTTEGETYTEELRRLTGRQDLATGYGMVTHYYNLKNGLVPDDASTFCTIQDYVAMKLAGKTKPSVDPSDGASFGLFLVDEGRFDGAALEKAGIDPQILPELATEKRIGTGALGIPIYVAIGDNQASFLGATGGKPGSMLINMGTGGQFSAFSSTCISCEGLETRPFPMGGWLLVGASLCGGRAYATLEAFFRAAVRMYTGVEPGSCYGAMERMLDEKSRPVDLPIVTPLFQGTRKDPALRGTIENISTDNLTPLHLTYGLMHGMAAELHGMYQCYLNAGGKAGPLFGSGNGLRKNRYLCWEFEALFGQPLQLSPYEEEAA